jgi:hypothetical protein
MTMVNFTPPLTYAAKLRRRKGGAAAQIKLDGGTTDGLITFTDSTPARKCRLELEGEPGLYLITNVELDVQDVRTGEKLTLKGDQSVFVALQPPEPPEPEPDLEPKLNPAVGPQPAPKQKPD